jgi:hypothetical protein
VGEILAGVGGAAIWEALKAIIELIKKKVEDPGDDDEEDEIVEEGNTSLCLTDTGLSTGVDAKWAACGANGTVWIWVPHGNGFYLKSRFAANRGKSLVLTVDPLSNGSKIYVASPANSGSPYWQTFTYFFTLL